MQNNKEHTHSKDEFSELVKQKLENYSVPVDEQCWAEIEQRLKPKRTKMPVWTWLSVASVAAGLALLFTLNPFPSDIVDEQTIVARIATTPPNAEEGSVEQPEDRLPDEKIEQTEPRVRQKIDRRSSTQQNMAIAETSALPVDENRQSTDKPSDEIVNFEQTVAEVTPAETQKPLLADADRSAANNDAAAMQSTDSERNEKPKLTTLEDPKDLYEIEKQGFASKKKNNNKWALALAYGASSGISTTNDAQQSIYNDGGARKLAKIKTRSIQVLGKDDFSDIRYLPPVSLGFNVRKDITPTLGVAVGLNYTYLSTYFEYERAIPYRDATLQLHYLGVPVNLIVNLYDRQRWNIYLSGGAMVEKGLEQYKQNIYHENITEKLKKETPTLIDGMQWSANTTLGISYEIFRNIGVYFEPRASYFFANNQPISLRTKQPFTVSLNVGLQYRFN